MSNTTLLVELHTRIDLLEQWKREATTIIDPIIEYGQGHPAIKLGSSISAFVIERCKQVDELKRLYDESQLEVDEARECINEHHALKQQHQELKERVEKMVNGLNAISQLEDPKAGDARIAFNYARDIANTTVSSWKEGEQKEGQP